MAVLDVLALVECTPAHSVRFIFLCECWALKTELLAWVPVNQEGGNA
jgi:hypothetical protein